MPWIVALVVGIIVIATILYQQSTGNTPEDIAYCTNTVNAEEPDVSKRPAKIEECKKKRAEERKALKGKDKTG